MKKKLKSLLSLIDATSEYTGKFYGIFLIIFLIGIIVVEVIARYGFSRPIPGAHDAMTAYFGAYYLMAGAYTLLVGAHVRVDVLWMHFNPRGKAIFDLITFPFFFLFVGVLVVWGWKFAMAATWSPSAGWILEFDHSFLKFPLFPLKWTIPIGGLLLLLQGIAKFVRDVHLVATRKVLE